MIKANELRIGNIFKIQTSSCGFHKIKINGITETGMVNPSLNEKSCECTIGSLQPIPLTPEILEKCGFVWNDRTKHWQIMWGKNGAHFIQKEPYYKGFGLQLGEGHYKIIYSLHQLQNLFFALTETELKVNLNVESVSG